MAELTDKQRRFVEAYLSNGRNAAAAYRTVYSAKASAAAASVEGLRLLKHPLITPLLRAAEQKVVRQTQDVVDRYAITEERILREVARIAFSDGRMVMKWGADGVTLRESSELTDDEAAIVSEVSQTITQHGGNIRLKLHSKLDALEKLGRNRKLWEVAPAPPEDEDAKAKLLHDRLNAMDETVVGPADA